MNAQTDAATPTELYRAATGLVAAARFHARSLPVACAPLAEDLLQEAAVRVLQSGRPLSPALVRTALRTAAIDHARRLGRRPCCLAAPADVVVLANRAGARGSVNGTDATADTDPLSCVARAEDELVFERRRREATPRLRRAVDASGVTPRQWSALRGAASPGTRPRSEADRQATREARNKLRSACRDWLRHVTGESRPLRGAEVDAVLREAGVGEPGPRRRAPVPASRGGAPVVDDVPVVDEANERTLP